MKYFQFIFKLPWAVNYLIRLLCCPCSVFPNIKIQSVSSLRARNNNFCFCFLNKASHKQMALHRLWWLTYGPSWWCWTTSPIIPGCAGWGSWELKSKNIQISNPESHRSVARAEKLRDQMAQAVALQTWEREKACKRQLYTAYKSQELILGRVLIFYLQSF